MEEFIGVTILCVLLGASGFLWFWPVPTLMILGTGAIGSLYWWKNFKKSNASLEFKAKLQEKIASEPRLSLVWKPNLGEQFATGIHNLIQDLQSRDIPLDALANLIQIKDKELPNLLSVLSERERRLQEFLYHNEIVHLATIKELSRQKQDGGDHKALDTQIQTLELKVMDIENQRREYEILFSCISDLISHMQQIRNNKKLPPVPDNCPDELLAIYKLLEETADLLQSLNNL